MEKLEELQRMVENYVREMAERQGLERDGSGKGFRLTPKAYRLFQGRLLERIFANLQASRSGRHQGPIVGEGAVEMHADQAVRVRRLAGPHGHSAVAGQRDAAHAAADCRCG